MTVHKTWLLVAAVGLLLGGCTVTEELRPVAMSSLRGRGPGAAYYELNVHDQNLGDVKVWSRGITESVLGKEPTHADLGLRVRNDFNQPLEVSDLTLEVQPREGDLIVLDAPTQLTGSTSVPPGSVQRLLLRYDLPDDLALEDVVGVELNWTVSSTPGAVTESTPFRVEPDSLRDRFYSLRYDPWGYAWDYPYYYPGHVWGWHRWGPGDRP